MAFPLTHLCVAYRIIEKADPLVKGGLLNLASDEARRAFILGSIAPDAVHYRKGFVDAEMSGIGATKKVVHLCPISGERWGQVTDNDGWVEVVRAFLRENSGDVFAAGYAVHVLTDIFNNKGIWNEFRVKYPAEAAKGYKSDYYRDMRDIDFRIYNEFFRDSDMRRLLQESRPQDFMGLIIADELRDLKDNLLYVAYETVPNDVDTSRCFYVTYPQMLEFINDAAEFCLRQMYSGLTLKPFRKL